MSEYLRLRDSRGVEKKGPEGRINTDKDEGDTR